MRRLRQQSGTVILFLVMAVLLSYSGPAEGGQTTKKFLSDLKDIEYEWQTHEEMPEEGSNEEMRMVGSVVAQRNQYPYMVRSNFKFQTSGTML